MRSQRELSEAGGGPPIGTWNRREASAPGGYAVSSVGGEEEDYGRLVQGQYSSGMGSRHLSTRDYVPASESVYSQPQSYSHSPPSDVGTSISARMAKSNSASGSDVGQRHGAASLPSRESPFLTLATRLQNSTLTTLKLSRSTRASSSSRTTLFVTSWPLRGRSLRHRGRMSTSSPRSSVSSIAALAQETIATSSSAREEPRHRSPSPKPRCVLCSLSPPYSL